MKTKIIAVIAVALSAIVMLFGASSASADVPFGDNGARLYNICASNGKVVVDDNGHRADVWMCRDAHDWNGIYDVDYFWVPGGCDAWNYDTGYKYVGNRWYGPLPNTAYLRLKVIC